MIEKMKTLWKKYWIVVVIGIVVVLLVVYATRVNWQKATPVDKAYYNQKVDSLGKIVEVLKLQDSVSKRKIDSLQGRVAREQDLRDSVTMTYNKMAESILGMNADESILQLRKYLNDEK